MYDLEDLTKVVTYENGSIIDIEYVCYDEDAVEFMEDIASEYIGYLGAKVVESSDTSITLDNSEHAGCESIVTIAAER